MQDRVPLYPGRVTLTPVQGLARSALGASGGASLVLTPSGRLTAGGEEDGIATPESELTLDLSGLPEGAKISYFSFEAAKSGSASTGSDTYLVSFGLKINGDKYTIGQESFTRSGSLSDLINTAINSQTLFGVSPSKSDTVSLFLESEITSVGSGYNYIQYTITVSLRYLPG